MLTEKLSLQNICHGALPEIFNRSLATVLKNIRDPNTDAEVKRTLTLKFEFKPHADRSGADVILKIEERLATIPLVKGAFYLSAAGGELTAYPNDPRQEVLFDDGPQTKQ